METRKTFVNRYDKVEITCPQCGNSGTHYVGRFKGPKRTVKIRCKCGSHFSISFEFRRSPRQETDIQGYYARLPHGDEWKKMLVTNISVGGVGLLTHAMHNLSIGDQLKVRFSMNGARRALVERDAVVRWISDGNLGCEFREPVEYHQNTFEYIPPSLQSTQQA